MQLLPAYPPALLAVIFASWCVAVSGVAGAQGLFVTQPRAAAPKPAVPFKEKGPSFLDAETLEGIMDIELTARGKAEYRQDDTTIFGDVLRMNQEFNRVDGEGGVRFELGNDRFSGSRLRFDTRNDSGTLEQPKYNFRGEERPIRGQAQRMEFLGKDHYRIEKGSFTTCEPGKDDWRLDFGSLELDYEDEIGTGRDATIRFFDTAIATVPYLSFPLEKRRKSGLLSPTYAQTSRGGLEMSFPIYWNIAPEQDATITPRIISKRGTQLNADYRYLDRTYAGSLRLEYLPEDNQLKRSRSGFSILHSQNFAPNLFGRLDLNKVSDDRYYVDLFSRVRQTSQTNLQREAFLQYSNSIFGQGYGASFRLQRFQTLQDPLAPVSSPYQRVPQLNFSTARNDIAGFADVSLPAEYVRFTHPTLVQGSRVTLHPTVSAPFLTPGAFFTPRLGLRHVTYDLDRTAVGQPSRISSTIPWVTLDGGLVFERDTRLAGRDLTHTLEPRIYYTYVPYRDQSQIPLFDTGLADLNFSSIFSENRFAGGDRMGDANQVTLATTSRLLFPNGQEFLRATVGQRFFFKNEEVPSAPGAPLRTFNSSDLLGAVSARLAQHWNFDSGVQYNARLARTERASVNFRYAPEIAKVLNFGYRFNRNTVDQIDISGQWPVSPGWYAVGRYNYSLRDRLILEGVGGLEYNAGCWAFRVVAQRLQVASQLASTSIYLQLELNDFAKLGSDPIDLLRRTIPGYSPTNLTGEFAAPSARPKLPFEQVY
jgi:LPS-assembly protein